MGFCKFCKDLTTGKDNETHDVVRVAMIATTCGLVAVMIFGSLVYMAGYIYSLIHPDAKVQMFDIQTFFNANSTMAVAISAFLMGGASALFFKKTTEPDGSETTTTSIKTGDGAAEPQVEVTKVTQVNNVGPQ